MNLLPLSYVSQAAADPNGFGGSAPGGLREQIANPFSGLIASGPLATATVQRGLLLKDFPQYDNILRTSAYIGASHYHSLELRADKRFAGGGVLSANYTFSKNTSNAETLTSWLEAGQGVAGYQTPNDLTNEWSLSSFDARHRAVISYVYDLPFGQGKPLLGGTSGVLGKLVSGWTLEGATTFQLGFPLGLTATGVAQGWPSFGYALRPNVVPNCDRTVSGSAEDRLNQWFNTSCFTLPAPYKFGNESRVDPIMRSDGISNWNMTLAKRTSLTEQLGLTFRLEAFNLFNTPQFASPNTQRNSSAQSQFGKVTSQYNQPRLLQLALRLSF
jgi:hypothetical protein